MNKIKLERLIAIAVIVSVLLSAFPCVYASDDSIINSFNNATEATIANAVAEYLNESGNGTLYNVLPECDKLEINKRMLAEIPYSNIAAVDAAYKKAADYTTGVDLDKYNKALVEDFSNLDAGWTQTGVDTGAIGNGKLDVDRHSLPVTDEDYSFFIYGGGLRKRTPNYIERDVENPQSVITMYMKVVNNDALSFSATFDGSRGICLKNTGLKVHTLPNETIRDTGVVFQPDIWNKITFDGTEAGKVNCYVNGNLAAAFDGSITKLSVGTIFDFTSFSVIAVDHITIAEAKPDTGFIDDFNANKITADSFSKLLPAGKYTVFNKLPECDKTEIIDGLEQGKPYADKNAVEEKYDELLAEITQCDSDKYEIDFTENFGNGISYFWESAKQPSVGSFLNNTVDNLNITGQEEKSAIFWGKSISAPNGEETVTGDNQKIKRAVEKNSKVSLYFWDPRNDNSAFLGIKVNDKIVVGAYGVTDNYCFSASGENSMRQTSVPKNPGWHKVVFDAAEVEGKTSVYLDGILIETVDGTTEYLEIGNLWSITGYAFFAVDNITAARKFMPRAKNVNITDRKTSLEVSYDYSHSGGFGEGATKFKWYRKNADGNFEVIKGAAGKVYNYDFPDDMGKTFCAEVIPEDNKSNVGDPARSSEFTESYMSGIRPVVSSAEINGAVYAGSVLTAQYSAAGGTDASKDKYKWFVSDDGTEWKQLEDAKTSVYVSGTEIIGKKIKFAVSVAGREGSYSDWTESAAVSDTTTIIQMISVVKAKTNIGRNQEMLDLLKLLDSAFGGYSTGHQQKIVINIFNKNVITDSEYRALVASVLAESDIVSKEEFDKVNGTDGIIIGNIGSGGGKEKDRFTDIDGAEWAIEAINALADKNIISGKAFNRFSPNDNVTRAEFATMIVRTFLPTDYSAKQVFTDVDDDSWYSPYAATAYARGIISGKADGTFGPNDAITREEMAVICARVYALDVCDKGVEREYTPFADENDISEYAYDSVVEMYKKSFINGIGNNIFGAKSSLTRAMAARIVFVMIKAEERYKANGIYKTENFEEGLGIFKSGKPGDSTVTGVDASTRAYSGTGSIRLLGKCGAYTEAGDNKVFRVMIYDDTEKADVAGMLSAGSYQIGISSYYGSARRENYAYVVNDSWQDAGIARTTGWHEFIIDMSRVGFVDLYIDGRKIYEAAEDASAEYVLIGNEWYGSTNASYADEFRMARTLDELYKIKEDGYSNGNALINNVRIDMNAVDESYREAAGLLAALEILAPDENGKIGLDEKITRKEFAYLLCGMMNVSNRAKTATRSYYTDVDRNDKYAGYIKYITESGLAEKAAEEFHPDAPVTREFAAKSMLMLLGYSVIGENDDESRWLNQANDANLFKGAAVLADGLTKGDAIKLCYNTLFADMVKMEALKENSMTYSVSDKVIFMNYYFDLYYVDDYLNGVYGTELSDKRVLNKNEVLLGNMVVKNYNSELKEYNGMYMRTYIYAPKSDDLTLVYAYDRGKSKSVVVSAHDIGSVTMTGMKYDEGEKARNVKFNSDLKVIYNGAYLFGYTEEHLNPQIGYIRFVDTDNNGIQDIAFVMDYRAVKILSIDNSSNIIYDEYSDTAYDLNDAELITGGIYKDFSVESLSVGQTVLIAQSACKTRVDILDDALTVEGSVTSCTDKFVYIDDDEYYRLSFIDNYFTRKGLAGFAVGNSGEFIIDSFGNVIGVGKTNYSNKHFGYVMKVYKDEAEETYSIKMYVDSGSVQKYDFAKKVKYNDENLRDMDELLSISPQLVRFKTKTDGTINSIETADTNHIGKDTLKGSEKFWLYRDVPDLWFRDNGYYFGLSIRTTANTPIMFVPDEDNLTNEKKYSMGTRSQFTNGQSGISYKAYNVDEFNFPEIIVVNATVGAKLLKDNETPLFVVSNVSKVLNDDDEAVTAVYGYESGEEKCYLISEDVDLDAYKQSKGYSNGIEIGDTFIPAVNNDNELTELRYIVRMEEASSNYDDLSVWNFVFDNISCCYAKIERSGEALKITDGTNNTVLGAPERVYVFYRGSRTLRVGTSEDLVRGRDIAIRTCHGNTREVIVYVD